MKKGIPDTHPIKEIMDNTSVPYLIIEKGLSVTFANEPFLTLTELCLEDILGKKCYSLKGRSSACQHCVVQKTFDTGKKQYRLNRELDSEGKERYHDTLSIPLLSADGKLEYTVQFLMDRTEELLRQKQFAADLCNLVDSFTALVETKDAYTAAHSKNVRDISMLISQHLKLSPAQKRDIFVAASLHDIGKIGIPDAILNKPNHLTAEEYDIIKNHPRLGMQLLSTLANFDHLTDNILYHHERWDGNGYPSRIAREEIPIGARIIAVADSYDAMISNRSYRKGQSHSYAAQELILGSGTQFDPHIVSIFLDICAARLSAQGSVYKEPLLCFKK